MVLSPAPPLQTVRSVFPNTAYQLSSSKDFRRSKLRSSRRHFIEAEGFVVITVRKRLVAKAVVMMFAAQAHTHPIAQIISQSRHRFCAVAIVEVSNPSSDNFIHPLSAFLQSPFLLFFRNVIKALPLPSLKVMLSLR
jgi:hypothetical protein